MRLATWNVNSVRARLPRLLAWLADTAPDVVCLQETKCAADDFPSAQLADLGYASEAHGDGRWNGVALLSRVGMDAVTRGLPGEPGFPAPEPRAIGATCGGLRVWSVYVPNGRTPDSPHYAYKLRWLSVLRDTLAAELAAGGSAGAAPAGAAPAGADGTSPATADPTTEGPATGEEPETTGKPATGKVATDGDLGRGGTALAVCGDFNVAPTDADVWDPAVFIGSTHVTPAERAALAEMLELGLTDIVPTPMKGPHPFTYWDYRAGMFHQNKGMRIDLVYASRPVSARLRAAYVDREARKGSGPSDHAPIVVDIDAG